MFKRIALAFAFGQTLPFLRLGSLLLEPSAADEHVFKAQVCRRGERSVFSTMFERRSAQNPYTMPSGE